MKKAILTIVNILFVVTIFAQTQPDIKSIIGKNERVTASAETDNSYWFGTNKGLYRIKKKSMKVSFFNERNSALPSNNVTCICTKPDGEVYVGTNRGIMRYDLYAFLNINTENSDIPSNNIKSLSFDPIQGIVVKTNDDSMAMVR